MNFIYHFNFSNFAQILMFKGCKNIDCMKRSLSLYGDNCQAV